MWGGECSYYTRLVSDATEAAMDSMVDHAKVRAVGSDGIVCLRCRAFVRFMQGMEANGVVNVKVVTATTMNRLIIGLHATVIVYGTVSFSADCGQVMLAYHYIVRRLWLLRKSDAATSQLLGDHC